MTLVLIGKIALLVLSAIATILSFIFTISPRFFAVLEEVSHIGKGKGSDIVNAAEGEIDFINVWLIKNRYLIGPVLVYLSALNTKNAFLLIVCSYNFIF